MPTAETPFLGLIGAPFYTAGSDLCTMPLADSSADSIGCASFRRADFVSALHPMQSTYPSFPGLVCTSFMITNGDFRPVTRTHPSSDCPFCASLVTACSALRPMTLTDSSIDYLIGASFVTA
eukprot:CAMPEP_0201883874 /NCGR_PEP_ID=MMETSP0902-20130614/16281_1 /ASSEMBLY_ACC=CAM_ASM_000551 /TAXON_ID=420261 /ORGANISM="Thalassiosira antarctica, Strain CCMP982" /LENGTH=121 /DNA_ID=CAMNT_0048412741 /DNA_START=167 /DNA_END=532 /DNA_ORIENTATION=-